MKAMILCIHGSVYSCLMYEARVECNGFPHQKNTKGKRGTMQIHHEYKAKTILWVRLSYATNKTTTIHVKYKFLTKKWHKPTTLPGEYSQCNKKGEM